MAKEAIQKRQDLSNLMSPSKCEYSAWIAAELHLIKLSLYNKDTRV
jgi:hypothetical protein